MLEEMIKNLKKYSVAEISYKTGVSISTVNNILNHVNENPTLKVLGLLQAFIEDKNNELS